MKQYPTIIFSPDNMEKFTRLINLLSKTLGKSRQQAIQFVFSNEVLLSGLIEEFNK